MKKVWKKLLQFIINIILSIVLLIAVGFIFGIFVTKEQIVQNACQWGHLYQTALRFILWIPVIMTVIISYWEHTTTMVHTCHLIKSYMESSLYMNVILLLQIRTTT